MTALTCVVCSADIQSGRLCRGCLIGTTRHPGVTLLLGDLAGPPARGSADDESSLNLLAEVEVTIRRQTRMGSAGGGSASSERPLPIACGGQGTYGTAIQARDGAVRTVGTWWRVWQAECHPGITLPTVQGPYAARYAASELIGARVWIASHDAADELVDDIVRAHAALLSAIDTPQPRTYLGPCGCVDEDGNACPGDVHSVGGRMPTCDRCKATHAADERRLWLDSIVRDPDRLYTAVDLAWALRIKPDRVRQWASRGRLIAHGHDAEGHATYRLGDAEGLKLASDRRGSA